MPSLEFALDPADIGALTRLDGIRPSRSYPIEIVWLDTPGQDLATASLALCTTAGRWRLTPLHASTAAASPALLAEARRPRDLCHATLPAFEPAELAPYARLEGRRQSLRATGADGSVVTLQLLHGAFAAGLTTRLTQPACRLRLDGDASALATLAAALAASVRLHVPRAGLAEHALAAPGQPPPRALGAPRIARHQVLTDSVALIIGHLADVILHWSDHILAAAPARVAAPEPVHQMRVATRRLRSALAVFKPAAAFPALAVPLKQCATRLGVAREWDVFLDGLGAHLAAAFPEDVRCRAMIRAAGLRRRAAYADLRAYLAGPDFRTLAAALACTAELRPWQTRDAADALSHDTATFAAAVLARRLKRVRRAGRGLAALPIPALHELRKDCKRLRYASEFFAALFPPKRTERFVARLASLQEELGLLNDGAAVAGLMAQLGRRDQGYAAGLAEGFSAAQAAPARDRIARAWKRFRAQPDFWTP